LAVAMAENIDIINTTPRFMNNQTYAKINNKKRKSKNEKKSFNIISKEMFN